MKRLLTLISILCAVSLSGSLLPPAAKADSPHRESAVVEFPDQVKLLGVFLKGQYLIVHDDEMMARGDDCTYVYSLKAGRQDKLIVSFHCTPVAREKAEQFTVRTSRLSPAPLDEVREIQFAGSSEAHQLLSN
jgi:hypothetical protein